MNRTYHTSAETGIYLHQHQATCPKVAQILKCDRTAETNPDNRIDRSLKQLRAVDSDCARNFSPDHFESLSGTDAKNLATLGYVAVNRELFALGIVGLNEIFVGYFRNTLELVDAVDDFNTF